MPQATRGFPLFDLLYRQKLRGLLNVIKENREDDPVPGKNFSTPWSWEQNSIHRATYDKRNFLHNKEKPQLAQNNKYSQLIQCALGDEINSSLSLNISNSKCFAMWQGCFQVTWQVGKVDFEMFWTTGEMLDRFSNSISSNSGEPCSSSGVPKRDELVIQTNQIPLWSHLEAISPHHREQRLPSGKPNFQTWFLACSGALISDWNSFQHGCGCEQPAHLSKHERKVVQEKLGKMGVIEKWVEQHHCTCVQQIMATSPLRCKCHCLIWHNNYCKDWQQHIQH